MLTLPYFLKTWVKVNESYILRCFIAGRLHPGIRCPSAGTERRASRHSRTAARRPTAPDGFVHVEELLQGQRPMDGQVLLPMQHAAAAFGDVEPAADGSKSSDVRFLGQLQ